MQPGRLLAARSSGPPIRAKRSLRQGEARLVCPASRFTVTGDMQVGGRSLDHAQMRAATWYNVVDWNRGD